MLVACLAGHRVEAESAERASTFVCPKCSAPVILKRGRIITAHFAHKPPVVCSWGTGESGSHLDAKRAICDAVRARGLKADVEVIVPSLAGDRRADVLVTSPDGKRVAIEIQHTPLSFDVIEARTRAYMAVDIAVIWVAMLPKGRLEKAERVPSGFLVKRYAAKEFERWAHGFHMGQLWFWDVDAKALRQGKLAPHVIQVPVRSWFTEYGDEESAGGYERKSKRYRDLVLGPAHNPASLRFRMGRRDATRLGSHNYPGGVTVIFEPAPLST
jgi:competence protein CoiA